MSKFLLNRICLMLLLVTTATSTSSFAQVANVSQTGIGAVFPGDPNQPIIVIDIIVSTPGYTLGTLFLSTAGSTPSAIANAKVFYTGSSSSFSTGTQFGSTVTSPNGAFSVNAGGPYPLSLGDNYFWVAYDIALEAVFCDTVDALCSSITGSTGAFTPVPSDPTGFAIVGDMDCIPTAIVNQSRNKDAFIFPNPSNGKFSIHFGNEPLQVTVFNTIGKRVFSTLSLSGQIDVGLLAEGIYYLEATGGNRKYTSRIAIIR
jgi:hypothetical protein